MVKQTIQGLWGIGCLVETKESEEKEMQRNESENFAIKVFHYLVSAVWGKGLHGWDMVEVERAFIWNLNSNDNITRKLPVQLPFLFYF